MKYVVAAITLCCILSLSTAQQRATEWGGKANIERGRYIAEHVALCIQCHTPRDGNGELILSRSFEGAAIPVAKPAQLRVWAEFAPRIAGLPQYSDEQLIRLLTTGIGREGKPLRSPMPTFKLSWQDAADIAVYLRSIK
ncbi:MAG: c-type cytochrome [Bacteroidetes bacterium]|nr:c-type cytochrome [Bacteroidota bacterium]MCW5895755.1 c-type cytochrome [Bacteroidota bacterium]